MRSGPQGCGRRSDYWESSAQWLKHGVCASVGEGGRGLNQVRGGEGKGVGLGDKSVYIARRDISTACKAAYLSWKDCERSQGVNVWIAYAQTRIPAGVDAAIPSGIELGRLGCPRRGPV